MEKLRPAKSFDELRIGMIVVVKNCGECGRSTCRGMLTELCEDFLRLDRSGLCRGFVMQPQCVDDGNGEAGIGEDVAFPGDVFIVEDGLNEPVSKRRNEVVR